MEFRPVVIQYETSKSGQGNEVELIKVDLIERSYNQLFDGAYSYTIINKHTKTVVGKGYETSSAYMLSPYKIFSKVFDKNGLILEDLKDESFRTYDLWNSLKIIVPTVTSINSISYETRYDDEGGSRTKLWLHCMNCDNHSLRISINESLHSWRGIYKDLVWEEEQSFKLRGKDVLEAALYMKDYPGFK